MFESRDMRNEVEEWVNAQKVCPTRKQTKAQFPNAPLKAIRSALQSRQDKERPTPPANDPINW